VGLEGLDPPPNAATKGKTNDVGGDFATYPSASTDPGLGMVLEARPGLSEAVRKAIMALIGTGQIGTMAV
jgi:hypothetical protein